MNRRGLWVTIAIVAAFLAGTGFGKWATQERWGRRWDSDGKGRQERMRKTFSAKLDLTGEQRAQVAAILEEGHLKMRSLHEQVQPQFEALRNETHDQLRALLTPAQTEKFSILEAEMAKERERRWGNVKNP